MVVLVSGAVLVVVDVAVEVGTVVVVVVKVRVVLVDVTADDGTEMVVVVEVHVVVVEIGAAAAGLSSKPMKTAHISPERVMANMMMCLAECSNDGFKDENGVNVDGRCLGGWALPG